MWIGADAALSLLTAQAITTSTAGGLPVVDLSTYASLAKRSVKAVIHTGTFTTSATCTAAILESDSSSSGFAAPANGTTSVVITAAGVNELNFAAQKRYVKLQLTVDAAGSIPMAASLIAMKRFADS